MRALAFAATLIAFAGLASGQTAPGAALDDWLAAVDATHPRVVIAPRLGAVLDPLGRAVRRARSHPVVGEASAASVADLVASLGVDPFDADALDAAGVALGGPLLVATGERGFAVVPVRQSKAVAGLIEGATGTKPQPAKVAGRDGWRWPDGAAVWVDGMLFAARDAATVSAVLAARSTGERPALSGCAQAAGGADLFVLTRGEVTGCLTARVDPGRVRVEWRGTVTGWSANAWLGAPVGLPSLGPATLVAALAPGRPLDGSAAPTGVAPASVAPAYAAVVAGMVRSVALAAGPAPADLLVEVELRDPTAAAALVERVEAAPPDGVRVDRDDRGLLRLVVAEPAAEGFDTAWLGVRDTRLMATTRADVVAGRALSVPKTGLSPRLFEGASALLYLRPTGAPHDGRAYTDALRPALAALGLEPDALGQAAGAVVFLTAHLGALGVAVAADGEAWRVAVEVETL